MAGRENGTLGGRPLERSDKRLTLYDRVVRARAIAAARVGPKPTPWAEIARQHGVAQSTAKALFSDYQTWDVEVEDPLAAVDTTIALHTVVVRQLLDEVETGDNSAARVGAAKAALDAMSRLIELQQAMGRMPYSLHRFRGDADFAQITREVMLVLEKHDVSAAALREIHDTVRSHLPAAMENVRSIQTARRP